MAGKVNLQEQFARFDDHWSPKIVASVNDYDLKLVKAHGEFVWHQHDKTDEVILVMAGQLRIQLQDGDDVVLSPGELFVVPRGPAPPDRRCGDPPGAPGTTCDPQHRRRRAGGHDGRTARLTAGTATSGRHRAAGAL